MEGEELRRTPEGIEKGECYGDLNRFEQQFDTYTHYLKQQMQGLATLQKMVQATGCKIRLKVYRSEQATDWMDGFGLPVEGYMEVAGPERVKDVQWLEFDPVVITPIGRLVPPAVRLVIDEITQVLGELSMQYEMVHGRIRVAGEQLR